MNRRRFAATTLILLVLSLSFISSTIPQTQDIPLIISPGLDGIATVTPEYNIFVTPYVVVDANTTFTDIARLYCPGGYQDLIGIANLTLNTDQIKELQIFVTAYQRKIVLYHYRDGSIIRNNTFILFSEFEAIMGISITSNVTQAGPIDPISYEIFSSYGLRDVAVTEARLSATEVYTGYVAQTLDIEVTVRNEGTAVETFNVTVFWDDPVVEEQVVTGLAPGAEANLTFSWVVAGVPHGNYTITAVASKVEGESDLADNTYIAGNVTVKVLADADGDGKVVSNDFFLLVDAFGSRPGDSNWNPDCDFDDSGRVVSYDFFLLVDNFGYRERFVIDHSVTWGGSTYHVITESGSTVSNFAFSQPSKEISFNVTGPHGTNGYCKVTIPISLLGPPYTVLVDDVEQTHWFEGNNPSRPIVSFLFSLSTRKVRIIGTTVVS